MNFGIYSRRPLGKVLEEFLSLLESSTFAELEDLSLFSRAGRWDLPRNEIVSSASRSASDACYLRLDRGKMELGWRYGPHAKGQTIDGVLTVAPDEFGALRRLLLEICTWSAAVYGYCDQSKVIDEDISKRNGSLFPKTSFYGLYWYNYFGPEYAAFLDTAWPQSVEHVELEKRTDGALVVAIGSPGHPGSAAEDLAERWPFFEKYKANAKLSWDIAVDYSAVRSLPAPQSTLGTIASVVGPADEFIASVQEHSERFESWARSRGLEARTEKAFRALIRKHAQVIEDEEGLLVATIAAYGELVRTKAAGVWRKAILLNRGEPVVATRRRPWTHRRVILEVLRMLGKS